MKNLIEVKSNDEASCFKVCNGPHVHHEIFLIYRVNVSLIDKIEHIITMCNEAYKLPAVIDLHTVITRNKSHPILGMPQAHLWNTLKVSKTWNKHLELMSEL